MKFDQAQKELSRLKGLNDGKEYAITMSRNGKFTVAEKTDSQKQIDAENEKANPGIGNKKISDWLKEQAA